MDQTEATGENDPRDQENSDRLDASPTHESSGAEPLIDVPDDFDLDGIQSETSSTPATAKPRCPYCGSVRIHRKVNGSKRGAPRRTPGQYRCHTCREHFDDPQQADTDQDVLMTDGGSYDVDGERADTDELTSVPNQLNDAAQLLEDALEGVAATDDEWTANAIASILSDVRELRRLVKNDEKPDVATDGGVETRELPPAVDITAEHYSGDDRCAYGCGDEAGYRVTAEGERGPPFVACRPCLNRHNIYPEDNDLVTDGGRPQGRRAFPADAHSAISEAGVGDQAPGGGCRHSEDDLPCWRCFTERAAEEDER